MPESGHPPEGRMSAQFKSAQMADEALQRLIPQLESYGHNGTTSEGLHAAVRSLVDIRNAPPQLANHEATDDAA